MTDTAIDVFLLQFSLNKKNKYQLSFDVDRDKVGDVANGSSMTLTLQIKG